VKRNPGAPAPPRISEGESVWLDGLKEVASTSAEGFNREAPVDRSPAAIGGDGAAGADRILTEGRITAFEAPSTTQKLFRPSAGYCNSTNCGLLWQRAIAQTRSPRKFQRAQH
jgi:hypothetical protein